jgi:hypothetical protein
MSRQPLPLAVGAAIAQAVEAALAAGADPELPWVLTVGVPLRPKSPLWRDGTLVSDALDEASDLLRKRGLGGVPEQLQIVWAPLSARVEDDNYCVPVPTMLLWPEQARPSALITKHLQASMLPSGAAVREVAVQTERTNGVPPEPDRLLPQEAGAPNAPDQAVERGEGGSRSDG